MVITFDPTIVGGHNHALVFIRRIYTLNRIHERTPSNPSSNCLALFSLLVILGSSVKLLSFYVVLFSVLFCKFVAGMHINSS